MARSYAKQNPEIYREASRRDHYRKLARKHGVSIEELESLHERQQGLCAICERPETANYNTRTRRLCLDHDHATGALRAYLCSDCNRGIGMFGEDPDRLRKAARYVSQFRNSI